MAFPPEPEHNWKNGIVFLHKVTGLEIKDEYDLIGDSPFRFCTASQMFPRTTQIMGSSGSVCGVSEKKGELVLYDCFIYYKENSKLAKIQDNYQKDGQTLITDKKENVTISKIGINLNGVV